jgi:tetratricopeptide (TPR) repeat protein/DNA-binding CsgD family transcriptional regulator
MLISIPPIFKNVKGSVFFLLLFPFYIQSQTYESEKSFRDQQDSVFQLLLTDPSFAKERIDVLISKENQMTDTTKGLNYNMNGIYFSIIGNHDKSIQNFKKATTLLKNHPYRLNKVRKNIGTSLRKHGDYQSSINEFEKILNHYAKEKDSLNYAKVLGEIAASYNYTLNHEKAVTYLTRAIAIIERNNLDSDPDFGSILQRLANSYYKQSKFDYAIELYEKSLKVFKETNRVQNYYVTLINLAECFKNQKKLDTALVVIKESISGLEDFKNKNLLAASYGVKASILFDLDRFEEASTVYAIAYKNSKESNSERFIPIARDFIVNLVKLKRYTEAQKVYNETEPFLKNANIEYQYSFLLQSAKYFSSIGNNTKAFELSLLSHKLKDSSYYSSKQELVDELQTRYRVQEKEVANTELKLDVYNKEKDISILTLSTIIAVFMILFILIIWRSRINYKNKILELEKENNTDLTKKLETERENLELKQKLIKQQKSELMGYSMEVSKMNEKIENLITKFKESDTPAILSSQLKNLITVNKSWDSFIERFKEVDPEFIPRLSKKYSSLTQKDLEFCALVRMNISYKDIGNFLQISHESVFKKKYRISKKMSLDKDIEFQNYIIQF